MDIPAFQINVSLVTGYAWNYGSFFGPNGATVAPKELHLATLGFTTLGLQLHTNFDLGLKAGIMAQLGPIIPNTYPTK